MTTTPVNIQQVLASFTDLWSPRIVAQASGFDLRVAKFDGEYIWHTHADTDELFLVVSGQLVIQLREDGLERSVTLNQGDVYVVPRGTEHKPVTSEEAHILMLEPTGTVTVGDREAVPDHIEVSTGRLVG
jgi:mannose-6-phosphate isomerase-like protein (cupin superfamily)